MDKLNEYIGATRCQGGGALRARSQTRVLSPRVFAPSSADLNGKR